MESQEAIAIIREMIQQRCQQDREFEALSVALDALSALQFGIRWRRIKKGERLPCTAYLWSVSYDKYHDFFEGRLMPNVKGVMLGCDTWYLPTTDVHDLPKED